MKKFSVVKSERRFKCGSKKKSRNCHGKKKSLPSPKFIQEVFSKMQIAQEFHFKHFGHIPEIVSVVFEGRRLVSLEGKLIGSNHPTKDWQTPSDFLIDYLVETLDKNWLDEQIKLTNRRHIVADWILEAGFKINDANNPIESLQLNGSAFNLLHLAYDLYVLENQNCLSDSVIKKRLIGDLKIMPNFNGARYEIFMFATLLRAGFELTLFNQLKSGVGRISECRAKHIKTGVFLQAEAKTRNVKGKMGATQGDEKSLNLYHKLKNAMEKNVNEPYIIFVDLNLPEFSVIKDTDRLDAIRSEYQKLEEKYPQSMPNFVCFTNIPFHYEGIDDPLKNSAHGLILSKTPRFKLHNENIIFNEIEESLLKQRFLPRIFNESTAYADEEFKKPKL